MAEPEKSEVAEEVTDDVVSGHGEAMAEANRDETAYSLHVGRPSMADDMTALTTSGFFDTGTSFHTMGTQSDDEDYPFGDRESPEEFGEDTPAPAPAPVPAPVPNSMSQEAQPAESSVPAFSPAPGPMPFPPPPPEGIAPAPSPMPIPGQSSPGEPPIIPPPPVEDSDSDDSDDDSEEDSDDDSDDDESEEEEGSFVEEMISSSMLPPPPPPPAASPPPPAPLPPPPPPPLQSSIGSSSVPSGPEFKTKPIPSLSDDTFDPEANMIRPVEAPSPQTSSGSSPIQVPPEWFDQFTQDDLPTPVQQNKGDPAQEEEPLAPSLAVEENVPSPAKKEPAKTSVTTADLEKGETTLDRKKPPDTEPPYGEDRGGFQVFQKYDNTPCIAVGLCFLLLLLCGAAIYLILGPITKNVPPFKDDNNDPPPTIVTFPPNALMPPFAGDNPTTPLDPYVPGQCRFGNQVQPNILSQCFCNGRISTLQDDVRQKYEDLEASFIREIYGTWNYAIESCDPANQALVWLSTVVSANDVELTQRYALAYLYYNTGGDQWVNQDNWLEQASVCLWYGIACSGDVVSLVELESNQLLGSVSTGLSSIMQVTKRFSFVGPCSLVFSFFRKRFRGSLAY